MAETEIERNGGLSAGVTEPTERAADPADADQPAEPDHEPEVANQHVESVVGFDALQWQHAALGFACLGYWVLVLALPEEADPLDGWVRIAIAVVGVALGIVGVFGVKLASDRFSLRLTVAVAGVLLLVVAWITERPLDLGDARRFALGVGGLALMILVVGLQQFKTVRAAGGAALVVLFIGAATWPGASEQLDADVRERILTWTGVVLGATVIAEAAKQVAQTTANARTASALARAVADASVAGSPSGFTVSPRTEGGVEHPLFERVQQFTLPDPPGDLR